MTFASRASEEYVTSTVQGRPAGLCTILRSRVTVFLEGSSFAIRSNENVRVCPISSPAMPGHGGGPFCAAALAVPGAAAPGVGPTCVV